MKAEEELEKAIKRKLKLDDVVDDIAHFLRSGFHPAFHREPIKDISPKVNGKYEAPLDEEPLFFSGLLEDLGLVQGVSHYESLQDARGDSVIEYIFTKKAERLYRRFEKEGYYERDDTQ